MLSLFRDDKILYTENWKESFEKILELINIFSNVEGYKINMKKSTVYLYTCNEWLEM